MTLASFAAEAQANQVLVTWETVSEINNAGFNLYRGLSADGSDRTLLVSIPSQAPGSSQGASYSYGDTAVQDGQTTILAGVHRSKWRRHDAPAGECRIHCANCGYVERDGCLSYGRQCVAHGRCYAGLLLLLASGLVVAQQRRA